METICPYYQNQVIDELISCYDYDCDDYLSLISYLKDHVLKLKEAITYSDTTEEAKKEYLDHINIINDYIDKNEEL